MYKTKTLIIGASFLGIGYAAANQDCIIIEKGEESRIGFCRLCKP